MAALIDPADPADPIAAQFVPSAEELDARPDETTDPIGDGPHAVAPGVVHRYPDRVLLKPTHLCRVYCRFCFRRDRVGDGEANLSEAELDEAVAYITARPEIFEVILTGGDPMILSDRRLGLILDRLEGDPPCRGRAHPQPRPRGRSGAGDGSERPRPAPSLRHLDGDPRRPSARADRRGRGVDRKARRRRRAGAVADHAALRRQWRRGDARGAVPPSRGAPGEALLPPPPRSRRGDGAVPHLGRRGQGADEGAQGQPHRHRPADLRARHPPAAPARCRSAPIR